jgi:hypothetical protein
MDGWRTRFHSVDLSHLLEEVLGEGQEDAEGRQRGDLFAIQGVCI